MLGVVWASGSRAVVTVLCLLPSVVQWVWLRPLLGLNPDHRSHQAEELCSQTYSVLATLTIIPTFALVLLAGELTSCLMLAMVFLSLPLLFGRGLSDQNDSRVGKGRVLPGDGSAEKALLSRIKRGKPLLLGPTSSYSIPDAVETGHRTQHVGRARCNP